MTVHYHDCNGPGLPDYPQNVEPQDVNVWRHDSGMICTHDYRCPSCLKRSAVLNMSKGRFEPCWECQKDGVQIVRRPKGWRGRLWDWILN